MSTKDGPGGEILNEVKWDRLADFDRTDPVFGRETLDIPEGLAPIVGMPGDSQDGWSYSFSDITFENESHVLSYDKFSIRSFRSFVGGNDTHYDKLYFEPEALFPIGSMTGETYKYMQSLDTYLSAQGGLDDLISEPVVFQDNVDGGVGFFGIINVTVQVVRFKDIFIGSDIYY